MLFRAPCDGFSYLLLSCFGEVSRLLDIWSHNQCRCLLSGFDFSFVVGRTTTTPQGRGAPPQAEEGGKEEPHHRPQDQGPRNPQLPPLQGRGTDSTGHHLPFKSHLVAVYRVGMARLLDRTYVCMSGTTHMLNSISLFLSCAFAWLGGASKCWWLL